jgi:hypothetical protein
LYIVFIVLWHVDHGAYVALLNAGDFVADPVPYSDLNATLQAAACAHQGVNVYVPNHCMGGGSYNYSPFFLHLWSGIGPDDRYSIGLLFGILFLVAGSLLPPAQDWRSLAVRAAALCSGVVIWALQTANLDCLLFFICVAGLCLVLVGRAVGFAGYALFAFGGALKFYPAVLLALSLRESKGRFAIIAAVLAVGGAVFLEYYGQGVATALAILPAGLPFRGVFGALNWPFGLALLRFLPVLTMEPNVPQYFWALHYPYVTAYIVIASRLLTAVGLYTAFRLAPAFAAPLAQLPDAEKLFLAAGSLTIAFCFFAAQNLDYRAIFLLLTLPGMQILARSDSAARLLLAALLLLLWEGAIRHAIAVLGPALLGPRGVYMEVAFWMLREYAWWFVVVRLAAIAMVYLWAALQSLLAGTGLLLRNESLEV